MNTVQIAVIRIERMKVLANQIAACRIEAKKLVELEQQYQATHKELTELLDSMDVTARGNYGWERRIVPFLTEFLNCAQASDTSAESNEERP